MNTTFQSILKTATKEAKKRGYDMNIIATADEKEFCFSQGKILLSDEESIVLIVTPEGIVKKYKN